MCSVLPGEAADQCVLCFPEKQRINAFCASRRNSRSMRSACSGDGGCHMDLEEGILIIDKKRKVYVLLLLCMYVLFAGCSREKKTDGTIFQVYVVNTEETKIFSRVYETTSEDPDTWILELIGELQKNPEKLEYKAPLSGNFQLISHTLEGGQLILNFDEKYKELSVTTEVLIRAAVVRTMTQIPGVDLVSFQIRQTPLTDSSGNVVGIMSADQFIDNTESEINSREQAKLRLYFADEEGTGLVEIIRTLEYSSNVALEKLVVEELIRGPEVQVRNKAFPTIPSDTRILGVTIKDGTCYVNLSSQFLNKLKGVTPEVTIYSIVNSLIELSNVNRVQIAVDGDSSLTFMEKIPLSTVFDRNLDLIRTKE